MFSSSAINPNPKTLALSVLFFHLLLYTCHNFSPALQCSFYAKPSIIVSSSTRSPISPYDLSLLSFLQYLVLLVPFAALFVVVPRRPVSSPSSSLDLYRHFEGLCSLSVGGEHVKCVDYLDSKWVIDGHHTWRFLATLEQVPQSFSFNLCSRRRDPL